MKFKVGDRVKVKDNFIALGGRYTGKEGVVRQVDLAWSHLYQVDFKDLPSCYFRADELEKVE